MNMFDGFRDSQEDLDIFEKSKGRTLAMFHYDLIVDIGTKDNPIIVKKKGIIFSYNEKHYAPGIVADNKGNFFVAYKNAINQEYKNYKIKMDENGLYQIVDPDEKGSAWATYHGERTGIIMMESMIPLGRVVSGSIAIGSEFFFCGACRELINQFTEKYQNIINFFKFEGVSNHRRT